ncbi:MAG: 50S ribosomal protein L2 [Gammaproteobacteria bacterium]|jgi:large subunit ribosomal protein L2|tara:strand:+ start:5388 stop:6209 length:822 start_codon:yes stop_codon:yes gene_type:complete
MAIIKAKPTSPGRRFRVLIREDLHKGRPEKTLVESKKRISGRNNNGHITVRHKGGGHKRLYRMIDFKRQKFDVEGIVQRIEYDPNRSANIALIEYKDGEKAYIIAPKDLKEKSKVISGDKAPIKSGNCLPLSEIPQGTEVHCVEMRPGKGAQLIRSAGTTARLVAKEGKYATLRLSSGEMRKILLTCRATIGVISNTQHNLKSLGKAGAKRWRGVRPTVRGVAMNPVDHPHGGGEGKTSGGRNPVSPWGTPTKGYRTRKPKASDKLIVKRRYK